MNAPWCKPALAPAPHSASSTLIIVHSGLHPQVIWVKAAGGMAKMRGIELLFEQRPLLILHPPLNSFVLRCPPCWPAPFSASQKSLSFVVAGGTAGLRHPCATGTPAATLTKVSWAIRGVTIRSNSRSDFDAPNGIWSPLSALFPAANPSSSLSSCRPRFLEPMGRSSCRRTRISFSSACRIIVRRSSLALFSSASFLRLILTCSSSAAVRA